DICLRVAIVEREKQMKPALAYIRVSTQKQGRSGLGLEAQTATIERVSAAEGFRVIETYQDVESGSKDDRPALMQALARAKLLGCPIIVAKLDRLSRDVHFISGLMKEQVEFITGDLGRQADPFTLHIYAAFAERERKMISDRTRAAMAAAKARGQTFGNPNLAAVRFKGDARVAAMAREARSIKLAQRRARAAI